MTNKNTPKTENSQESNIEDNVEDIGQGVNKSESVEDNTPDYTAVINDLNDKILRASAEVQNIRRRAELDVQKAKSFSIESFAKDLLSVMDSLVRAADAITDEDAASDPKLKNLRDGVEITGKELANVFERNRIQCVNPLGEKFDPNLHQAISQVEDEKAESGTVLSVMQTGYVIKDRVLRPAMVVVVK